MGPKIVQTIAAEVRSAVKLLNYDRLDVLLLWLSSFPRTRNLKNDRLFFFSGIKSASSSTWERRSSTDFRRLSGASGTTKEMDGPRISTSAGHISYRVPVSDCTTIDSDSLISRIMLITLLCNYNSLRKSMNSVSQFNYENHLGYLKFCCVKKFDCSFLGIWNMQVINLCCARLIIHDTLITKSLLNFMYIQWWDKMRWDTLLPRLELPTAYINLAGKKKNWKRKERSLVVEG